MGSTTAGIGRDRVAVTEQFLGGQPVIEVLTFRPAILQPQQVRGMLDFGLGRLGSDVRCIRFHDEESKRSRLV